MRVQYRLLKRGGKLHELSYDNSEDYSITFKQNDSIPDEEVSISTDELAEKMIAESFKNFDPSNRQYSVYTNNNDISDSFSNITLNTISELGRNAQGNLRKILKINSLVNQAINENDIIGVTCEVIEANLNSNIKLSFNSLPPNYNAKLKAHTEQLIKNFNNEIDIDSVLSSSIITTYTRGNCIKYLRSKNGHHTVDNYPLGIAILSGYSVNGKPYVLIDINKLTNGLQKTIIRGKRNKPLFFDSMAEEIKNNFPKEIYEAYINKERYAKLDILRCGVNRTNTLGKTYGLTPIFKALKPNLMLDASDVSDMVNTKAKAKKIIHQVLRKETMGPSYDKKGLDIMAYAHDNLMKAWKNPTVVYTSPPHVERITYVEPKAEMTSIETTNQYRSRIISALGISFLNPDGSQTVSTSNISLKQLMKKINKMVKQEEKILNTWYSILLSEHNISQDYCPTVQVLDCELLELEIKKELAELLFSKYNCSYTTAYEIVGYDVKEEIERRKFEKDNNYDEILSPHPTAYNSAGNDDNSSSGRPPNSEDKSKQEYDKNYTKEVREN